MWKRFGTKYFKGRVKAKLGEQLIICYSHSHFIMYLPLKIKNNFNKEFEIGQFEVTLTAPGQQHYSLFCSSVSCIEAREGIEGGNVLKVRPKSHFKHQLKLIYSAETFDGYSDLELNAGQYQVNFCYLDIKRQLLVEQVYQFDINEMADVSLKKLRFDKRNFTSWHFNLHRL